MSTFHHYRIIPTARMVSYCRSFSDIAYSRQIAEAVDGENATQQLFREDFDLLKKFYSPYVEARHKFLNQLIRTRRNILELAVGTSIERGITVTADAENTYVGTDLPEMIRETAALFSKLGPKGRSNHHLVAANVLSYEELRDATRHFSEGKDLVIVHEGLWSHLTTDERSILAENIIRILEQHGGRWITPDITYQNRSMDSLEPELRFAIRRMIQRTAQMNGREFPKPSFEDRREGIQFFEKLGFDVTLYPYERGFLASVKELWNGQEHGAYEHPLDQLTFWEMSVHSRRH